jgi:hypothetical protein
MADAIQWAPGREAAFIAQLDHELRDAQQARLGLDRQHRDWLAQYRVSAKSAPKSFPYEGAFNYTLPMTAIDVDVLYARFMQTVHAPENLWTTQALNERWVTAAKPLQDFLQVLDHRLLRMYNVNKRVFLECTKLGTGIYKTSWHYEKRNIWGYDERGQRQRQTRIISAPVVDQTKVSDFYFPAYSYAIQPDEQGGAPWVAERIRIPLGRLFAMADATAPFMPNIDRATLDFIARFEEAEKPQMDVQLQELDYAKRANMGSATKLDGDDFDRDQERGTPAGASLQRAKEIELWEIHARFGTRSAYEEDDVVVWYHQPTRKIVRAIYAPYHHGKRPYDKIVYFPGDGFWGIGVCEQKEMFQALGSDLMNFTLDNVVLANSRMIVAKQGANIAPGEPIYPWKTFIAEGNVRDEFAVFPMADIYPSLPMMSQMIASIGEKRTGISDIQLGQMQNLPGRTPATTMMSLLQEGNRRPDLTIRDMRYEGLSQVGLKVLQLCQQYISSPVDFGGERWLQMITTTLGNPEGPAVAEKLRMPMEPVELGVGVSLTATNGSANKEVERQGALALLQLAGQIGPQLVQLVQVATQAQGTPIADVAMKVAQSIQTLYARTLEQHDVRDVEDVASLVDAAASMMEQQAQGGGLGGMPPEMLQMLMAGGGGGGADPSMGGMG